MHSITSNPVNQHSLREVILKLGKRFKKKKNLLSAELYTGVQKSLVCYLACKVRGDNSDSVGPVSKDSGPLWIMNEQ